jgi:hypothetical protein
VKSILKFEGVCCCSVCLYEVVCEGIADNVDDLDLIDVMLEVDIEI